jgi:hypothetical protein
VFSDVAPRGGRFVPLTPDSYDDGGAHEDRLSVERWASDRRTTVLIRPDGYVASAVDSADDAAPRTRSPHTWG